MCTSSFGPREPARDLFGDEEVPDVGVPIEELEAAVDAVVIGDGDEVHAARLGDAVDVLGPRVAVAALEEPHVAALQGVARVHVQVGTAWRLVVCADHRVPGSPELRGQRSGLSTMICSVADPTPR